MDVGIYVIHNDYTATGSSPLTAHEEPTLKPELFIEVEETIRFTMKFQKGEICEGLANFNQSVNQFRLDGSKYLWLLYAEARA